MPPLMRTARRALLTGGAGAAVLVALADPALAQSSDGARAFADKVVMIAELSVLPEKLEAFLDYTTANLRLSRSYPGNLTFDILLDESEPTRVLFYEVWSSATAQKEYMAWRTRAGDLTKLLSFLAAPPKFTALRSISM